MILLAALSLLVAAMWVSHWRTARAPAPKPASVKRPSRPAQAAPAVKRAALPEVAKRHARPRVAIVMDDLGYGTSDLDAIFDIGQPVTFSILPGLAYSRQTASSCKKMGYETMLHLPLEPKDRTVKKEPGTLGPGMDKGTVMSMLAEQADGLPGISGVSNHMGSLATEDMALMSVIMGFLKTRKLYYFDSLTSEKSVCREAAAKAGVRYARRDIFLDIPNDSAYIEKQMMALRKLAFARGRAIAVCHYRKNTVAALARMMPLFADDGIVFVRLSEMVI